MAFLTVLDQEQGWLLARKNALRVQEIERHQNGVGVFLHELIDRFQTKVI